MMMTDFRSLCWDISSVIKTRKETTVNEISLLTGIDNTLRIEAILELLMAEFQWIEKIPDGKELKMIPGPLNVDLYKYIPEKDIEEPAAPLYIVLKSEPIDNFYFDPEMEIPDPKEVLQNSIIAVFSQEDEALEYAEAYGYDVLEIEETKTDDEERMVII